MKSFRSRKTKLAQTEIEESVSLRPIEELPVAVTDPLSLEKTTVEEMPTEVEEQVVLEKTDFPSKIENTEEQGFQDEVTVIEERQLSPENITKNETHAAVEDQAAAAETDLPPAIENTKEQPTQAEVTVIEDIPLCPENTIERELCAKVEDQITLALAEMEDEGMVNQHEERDEQRDTQESQISVNIEVMVDIETKVSVVASETSVMIVTSSSDGKEEANSEEVENIIATTVASVVGAALEDAIEESPLNQENEIDEVEDQTISVVSFDVNNEEQPAESLNLPSEMISAKEEEIEDETTEASLKESISNTVKEVVEEALKNEEAGPSTDSNDDVPDSPVEPKSKALHLNVNFRKSLSATKKKLSKSILKKRTSAPAEAIYPPKEDNKQAESSAEALDDSSLVEPTEPVDIYLLVEPTEVHDEEVENTTEKINNESGSETIAVTEEGSKSTSKGRSYLIFRLMLIFN